MEALNNLSADFKIVLCDLQDRGVLLHRDSLIRDRLRERRVGLGDNTLPVWRRRRRGNPLFIILLETRDALEGGRRSVELWIGYVRTGDRRTRREGGDLRVHCGSRELPCGHQNRCGNGSRE